MSHQATTYEDHIAAVADAEIGAEAARLHLANAQTEHTEAEGALTQARSALRKFDTDRVSEVISAAKQG